MPAHIIIELPLSVVYFLGFVIVTQLIVISEGLVLGAFSLLFVLLNLDSGAIFYEQLLQTRHRYEIEIAKKKNK